jgi:hypothetical protein
MTVYSGATAWRLARAVLVLGFASDCLAQAKPAAAPAPRVLYVIDEETEEPLAGALVRDMITRNSMKTSEGGAVGLFVPTFVKKSGALIEVTLAGYQRSDRIFVDPVGDSTSLVIALVKEGAASKREVADSARRAFVRKRADSTVVQVVVLAEEGPPLTDASIVITRPDSTVLATRTSDSTGLKVIVLPDVAGDVHITVRKVGYRVWTQRARLSAADTFVAPIALRRIAQVLPGARVTARKNLYHIDADDIADADKIFKDALAVLRDLRPQMFGDRLRHVSGCGTASHIWVNGEHITFPPLNVTLPDLPRAGQGKFVQTGTVDRMMPNGKMGKVRVFTRIPPLGEAAAMPLVRAVLAGINPDHVAEMTYSDCFDTTFAKLFTNNAIFVVLKFGYEYDWDRGSVPAGSKPVPPNPR